MRKTDLAFSKKIQKYSRKTYTVEGITKQGTMVQLEGKSRMIRPWEIQTADKVETNPFPRVLTSPDVETALATARKARKEGKTSKRKIHEPVLDEAKKSKVSQAMVGKWVEADGIQGTVKKVTKAGLWFEGVKNGKRWDLLAMKYESGGR